MQAIYPSLAGVLFGVVFTATGSAVAGIAFLAIGLLLLAVAVWCIRGQ